MSTNNTSRELIDHFNKWYRELGETGDPERRTHLVRDAFIAGASLYAEELYGLRAEHSPLQARIVTWIQACFGVESSKNKKLRARRFIEEAIEMVQAAGLEKQDVIDEANSVYAKPPGEIRQEIGGVVVTLAGFAHAHECSIHREGARELERCWSKIDKIRERNLGKPQPT